MDISLVMVMVDLSSMMIAAALSPGRRPAQEAPGAPFCRPQKSS